MLLFSCSSCYKGYIFKQGVLHFPGGLDEIGHACCDFLHLTECKYTLLVYGGVFCHCGTIAEYLFNLILEMSKGTQKVLK